MLRLLRCGGGGGGGDKAAHDQTKQHSQAHEAAGLLHRPPSKRAARSDAECCATSRSTTCGAPAHQRSGPRRWFVRACQFVPYACAYVRAYACACVRVGLRVPVSPCARACTRMRCQRGVSVHPHRLVRAPLHLACQVCVEQLKSRRGRRLPVIRPANAQVGSGQRPSGSGQPAKWERAQQRRGPSESGTAVSVPSAKVGGGSAQA